MKFITFFSRLFFQEKTRKKIWKNQNWIKFLFSIFCWNQGRIKGGGGGRTPFFLKDSTPADPKGPPFDTF